MVPALVVASASVGVSILLCPILGLIIAFLFSGLGQLAVLVPNFFSYSKLAALIATAGYLFRATLFGDLGRAAKSKALLYYMAPALWFMLIGYFGVATASEKLMRLYNIAGVIALAFLVTVVPKNLAQLRAAVFFMITGSALLGVWVMFYGASGLTAQLYSAVEGVTVYYDHDFGIQLGLAVSLSWLLLLGASRITTLMILAADILLVICVLLTHSRTAWAGVAVSSVLTWLWLIALRGKWMTGRFILSVGFIGLVIGALWQQDFFAPVVELISPRIDTMSDPTATSAGRIEYLWPAAVDFIRDHPIMGGGLGSSASLGVAHNAFLEMGVEGGLIAIVIYLISVRFTLFGSLAAKDSWLRVYGFALGTYIVTVSQTNPSTFYTIPYGLVIGVVAWIEIHGAASMASPRRFPAPPAH